MPGIHAYSKCFFTRRPHGFLSIFFSVVLPNPCFLLSPALPCPQVGSVAACELPRPLPMRDEQAAVPRALSRPRPLRLQTRRRCPTLARDSVVAAAQAWAELAPVPWQARVRCRTSHRRQGCRAGRRQTLRDHRDRSGKPVAKARTGISHVGTGNGWQFIGECHPIPTETFWS